MNNIFLFVKGVGERIKNKAKNKKRISWHVIRYIRYQFIRNLLTGKRIKAKIPGQGAIRASEGVIRAR